MIHHPALKNRDYRHLIAGAAFNNQGLSGEQVVIGFLIIQATGSTAWVGITLAIYFLPFFVFGLLSGVIADWIDRRVLLRRIELASGFTLAVFAVSMAFGPVPLWQIIVFTLCAGSLRALHQPVRSSYAYDLVGKSNVVSGIGLLNLGSRIGQLLGALTAGYVMQRFGPAPALGCLVAGHLIAYALFRDLRTAGIAAVARRVSIGQNCREYVQELKINHLLLALLVITASVEIFGFSFATALPEIATQRLDIGAEGLGYLQGTRAFAGIVASVAFATFGAQNRTGMIYLLIIAIFGVAMLLLSQPTPFLAVIGTIFLISLCAASCDILSQSMMQLSVPNELRGRAMGIWVLALGFGPLGHLELGALSSHFSLTMGLAINGAILILISLAVLMLVPRIRRL